MNKIEHTDCLIAEYQRPAFDRLMQIVKIAKSLQQYKFQIKPRTNTLLVGSTGTGKTHLAKTVGTASEARTLTISALEWIPMGATGRGSQITWVQIVSFLNSICDQSKSPNKEEPFAIIILDEVDKLSTLDSSWQNYIRTEVFKLLDHEIPAGLKDEDDDHIPEAKRIELQKILKNRTMIIAAGAFQSHWDETGRPAMGFSQTQAVPESISLSTLADTISRELANRFQSQIVRLPELKRADYENILAEVAKNLPKNLSHSFLAIGSNRIEDAVLHKTGFRFAEEILLEAILNTHEMEQPKKGALKFHPPKAPTF